MVISSGGKRGLRSFSIIHIGKHGDCKTKFRKGRYINRNPSDAAKKAFNAHCRVKRIRGVCTLYVTVKETTQGSNNKVYTYKLRREKLKKPMVMFEGTDNEYLIEYRVTGKAVKETKSCKRKGQTRGRMARITKRKAVRSRRRSRRSRR